MGIPPGFHADPLDHLTRTRTSTRPHPPHPTPCPCRTRGLLAALSFPNLVVKVHQLSGRLVRSRYVLLASPRTERCITSSHKSSSRSFPWRISGCSGLCRI